MSKISKEDALASMTRFVVENGKYPTKYDCKDVDYLFPVSAYFKLLGPMRSLTILEDIYNDNPKCCLQCSTPLQFDKRSNTFCSQSCNGVHSNAVRFREIKAKPEKLVKIDGKEFLASSVESCLSCGKQLEHTQKFFCTLQCQADHRFKTNLNKWLSTGSTPGGNKALRSYLIHLEGNACSSCGITEHNGKPITFEVDHIDGNSENDSRENVCLICPNCHSQTDTYKGRNRGNGRHARAQRYRDGKSY